MDSKHLKILFSIYLFSYSILGLNAQEKLPILTDSEFSVLIPLSESWFLKSGLANRNLIVENGNFLFEEKHIEINQFVEYYLVNTNKLSFGARYRIKKAFKNTETDEIRFIQQYNHLIKQGTINITFRIRQEERFREELSFRTRYQLSFIFPLGKFPLNTKQLYLVTDSEALWSYGKFEKAELEQRFKLAIQNYLFLKTRFSIGPELRYSGYLNSPKSELFIVSDISLRL